MNLIEYNMNRTLWCCSTFAAAVIATMCEPIDCLHLRVSVPVTAFLSLPLHTQLNSSVFKTQAESFDLGETEDANDYEDGVMDFAADESARAMESLPPTVNNVTLCGRIGHVDTPVSLGNGYKALKISVATNERGRGGTVKTLWHKVVLYGQGNVDYVHSRARVGDRALAIGTLSYYNPPQTEGSQYRAKVSEVAVRSKASGHQFILLPKVRQQDEGYSNGILDDNTYNYNNI